jgi:hypothetical protein
MSFYQQNGGYGVSVCIEVCGTSGPGSTPGSRFQCPLWCIGSIPDCGSGGPGSILGNGPQIIGGMEKCN